LTEQDQLDRQACIDALGGDPSIPEIFEGCGGFGPFDDFVPLESDLATPLEVELIDDPSSG